MADWRPRELVPRVGSIANESWSQVRPLEVQLKQAGLRLSHFTCRILKRLLDGSWTVQDRFRMSIYKPACWTAFFVSGTTSASSLQGESLNHRRARQVRLDCRSLIGTLLSEQDLARLRRK